jgi:hypothetical protein
MNSKAREALVMRVKTNQRPFLESLSSGESERHNLNFNTENNDDFDIAAAGLPRMESEERLMLEGKQINKMKRE